MLQSIRQQVASLRPLLPFPATTSTIRSLSSLNSVASNDSKNISSLTCSSSLVGKHFFPLTPVQNIDYSFPIPSVKSSIDLPSLDSPHDVIALGLESESLWCTQPGTYSPSVIRKKRKQGFLKRNSTHAGREVLKRRTLRRRKYISI
jgi:large subunit ribosomal protein L34